MTVKNEPILVKVLVFAYLCLFPFACQSYAQDVPKVPAGWSADSAYVKQNIDKRIKVTGSMNNFLGLKDGRILMLSAIGESLWDSVDGGYTWNMVSKIVNPEGKEFPGIFTDESSLIRLGSGAIALTFWRRGYILPGHEKEAGGYALFIVKSYDEGKTWTDEVRISPVRISPISLSVMWQQVRAGTLIQTKTGRLIQPFSMSPDSGAGDGQHPEWTRRKAYGWMKGQKVGLEGHYHVPEFDFGYLCYSDDEGKTWKRTDGYIYGWLNEGYDGVTDFDEACVAETKDGRILQFGRSQVGRIVESESFDNGTTWSLVRATKLAASFSPSMLRRIPSTGDLLCVWNQVSAAEIKKGYRRGRLSAAISTDDGKTWKNFRTLEVSNGLDKNPRYQVDLSKSPVKCVKALDDVGEIPEGFMAIDYPNISIIGDNVFLSYPTSDWVFSEKPGLVNHSYLRIIPLSWFYE